MTRREAIKSLAVVLAASPFLRLPPEKRCSCDAPLASFEEWQSRRPKEPPVRMEWENGDFLYVDRAAVFDRIAYGIDQDILRLYLRDYCPVHGTR